MLFSKKVRDRMIPIEKYATVPPGATLQEAALSLRRSYCELDGGLCTEAGPRTVLVVDESGRLTGILDFRSFLRVLIPEIAGGLSERLAALGITMTFAEADAPALDEARLGFSDRVIKNAQTRVQDIMLKVRGTIEVQDSLMTALKVMFRNRITVLPVYSEGKLAGVLRDTDLFLAVADALESKEI